MQSSLGICSHFFLFSTQVVETSNSFFTSAFPPQREGKELELSSRIGKSSLIRGIKNRRRRSWKEQSSDCFKSSIFCWSWIWDLWAPHSVCFFYYSDRVDRHRAQQFYNSAIDKRRHSSSCPSFVLSSTEGAKATTRRWNTKEPIKWIKLIVFNYPWQGGIKFNGASVPPTHLGWHSLDRVGVKTEFIKRYCSWIRS